MSFNFLDDEVSEVEKANKDLAQLDRQSEAPDGDGKTNFPMDDNWGYPHSRTPSIDDSRFFEWFFIVIQGKWQVEFQSFTMTNHIIQHGNMAMAANWDGLESLEGRLEILCW